MNHAVKWALRQSIMTRKPVLKVICGGGGLAKKKTIKLLRQEADLTWAKVKIR